jgi:hypothetical protein
MVTGLFCYLGIHFLAFVLVFRHQELFRQERVLFLYHAVPAVLGAACVLAVSLLEARQSLLAEAVLVISLQGIYSLSFLELWSLTEGGYSLHILRRFKIGGGTMSPADMVVLEQIGADKRGSRLAALIRLGLIGFDGDGYRLTRRGRMLSGSFAFLFHLVNLKTLG